jgi:NUMOD4 motif./HNH endonuclease.
MNDEIWKDIKGFEGLYQISNLGNIKSLPRKRYSGAGKYYIQQEKIMKTYLKSCGYKSIKLKYPDGKYIHKDIHKLMAIAFIPNPDNLPQINHKNGIKTDNRIDNLEWCTPSHNAQHALNTGLKKPLQGEKHGRHILTEKEVIEIRKIKNINVIETAKKHGVHKDTIWCILKNKSWKHI